LRIVAAKQKTKQKSKTKKQNKNRKPVIANAPISAEMGRSMLRPYRGKGARH
jgi:hypothetical protein